MNYIDALSEERLPILFENNGKFYGGSKHDVATDKVKNDAATECGEPTVANTYPKAVIFVLCSKFFEAFSANGIRAILGLYLRDSLQFTEQLSTIVLHVFNFFGQFCPVVGAFLADNFIGNIKTISYFFWIYIIGWVGFVFVTLPIQGYSTIVLFLISMVLVGIGNGSIRACVTSLGATQYQLPQQSRALDQYFSHYYFIYTLGILLSKLIPPEVRARTQCFGQDLCYPAVFIMLAGILFIAWVWFEIGKFFYKPDVINSNNILWQVCNCMWYAGVKRLKYGNPESERNWIYLSVGRYSEEFVSDVAAFLRIIKIYLPLPIYFALLAQQDSTWTFQATQMDTKIFGYDIEPDQAKALAPILLLLLIPFWQYVIAPLLSTRGIKIDPIQSIAIGGICAAISFVCAALVQLFIENSTSDGKISILWQFPQFLLLMMGEVLLSIPGLQFSFTQAPASMKSVLTASWFMNNAIGNLIVVVVTEWKPVSLESTELLLYALMMFVGVIVFMYLSWNFEITSNIEEGSCNRRNQRHRNN